MSVIQRDRLFALVLALLICGCSSPEEQPDPEPAPVGGFAGFTIENNPTDPDSEFDVFALFGPGVFNDYHLLETPVGQCVGWDRALLPSSTFEDAGADLTLSGPGGSFVIEGHPVTKIYSYVGPANGVFVPGGDYELAGSGGESIDAFSVSFTAPTGITLTTPTPSADPIPVPRGDLDIAWTSDVPGGTVRVWIFGIDVDIETVVWNYVCTFDDTGAATIPAHVVDSLPAANGTSQTTIYVGKVTSTTFSVGGAAADPLVFFEARWRQDIELP